MNFFSYWDFVDPRETCAGIYLWGKTPLHKNFVTLGTFIRLKVFLTKVLSNSGF